MTLEKAASANLAVKYATVSSGVVKNAWMDKSSAIVIKPIKRDRPAIFFCENSKITQMLSSVTVSSGSSLPESRSSM